MTHADATGTPCRGRLWFRPAQRPGAGLFDTEPGWPTVRYRTVWRDFFNGQWGRRKCLFCRCAACHREVPIPIGPLERMEGRKGA